MIHVNCLSHPRPLSTHYKAYFYLRVKRKSEQQQGEALLFITDSQVLSYLPLNHDPWSALYTDSAVLIESNLI